MLRKMVARPRMLSAAETRNVCFLGQYGRSSQQIVSYQRKQYISDDCGVRGTVEEICHLLIHGILFGVSSGEIQTTSSVFSSSVS